VAINLILQYYKDNDPHRQNELDICLAKNLQNPFITHVHLLTESKYTLCHFPNSEKIIQTVINKRLTYQDAFEYANSISIETIWIVANADIFFDGTLSYLEASILEKQVYALTRHEIDNTGSIRLLAPKYSHGSQDAWIFKTPVPIDRMSASVQLGVPFCDHRIAYEFINIGFVVSNPSKLIKCMHLDIARGLSISEKTKEYASMQETCGNETRMTPGPYQCYIYPDDELNPDVYKLYITKLKLIKSRSQYRRRVCLSGKELMKLRVDYAKVSYDLQQVLNSKSWKYTWPFRWLGKLFVKNDTNHG